MKNNIDIQITVPNQTRYLSLVGRIGENMARELDNVPGDRETLGHHINVVLTEALVNAIKHASASAPDNQVQIRINVRDKELVIRVYDNGQGFDLDLVPANGCPDPLNERGRGIFIIRSLMDSVEYKKANGGNVLEMKKKLG
ncbi:MAG: ATP-binding protein [Desulfobacteraceae bacterium]|nr:ATP-binding protein [Desulfobacteraceae bacterium]